MAKVIAGITISLDGYITGPNDRVGAGLGDGGERLHYWVFGGPWTYNGSAACRRRQTSTTRTSRRSSAPEAP